MADELHTGHRERLRNRFIGNGLGAFEDHEALELLLTYAIPRRDVNPIAHKILQKFGSLKAVSEASVEELCTVEGISENSAVLIRLVTEFSARASIARSAKKLPLKNIGAVFEYADLLFSGNKNEVFYMVCLDSRCGLIRTIELAKGTVDAVTVYPRVAVERALTNNAHSVILMHNHPSGESTPSNQDIAVTDTIVSALSVIGVRVYDHVVYSPRGCFSFSREKLLPDQRESMSQAADKRRSVTLPSANDTDSGNKK